MYAAGPVTQAIPVTSAVLLVITPIVITTDMLLQQHRRRNETEMEMDIMTPPIIEQKSELMFLASTQLA
ncbi:MAG: hypothetical protein ICV82_06680 [Nitrososphaera sp.]|nr:hypothetical protein [Nitrososphaera sp.]